MTTALLLLGILALLAGAVATARTVIHDGRGHTAPPRSRALDPDTVAPARRLSRR
ncbi:hypothetical protein ACFQ0K_00680 [Nocardioides caeni]|uniref:hypothetical protein n=1 Tax=Nocardioides caeni TaxID=574700 RepID=UPI0013052362|nr:hypothetical protein [Nocardioides caeni]